MTAIVAWHDAKEKKNYLVTDGRSVAGMQVTTDACSKITKLGEHYIACAGSPRAQQLLNLVVERGVEEFPSSPLELCEWVKAVLDLDEWVIDDSEGVRIYNSFQAVLVGPSGIFDIDCAFALTKSDDRISYRGSGGCDMTAALYALREVGCSFPVERQIEIALKCAGMVDLGCGGSPQIVSVDCAA